jgi:hypothetical protein
VHPAERGRLDPVFGHSPSVGRGGGKVKAASDSRGK